MSYYWIINIVKTPLKCITGLKIKYKEERKKTKEKLNKITKPLNDGTTKTWNETLTICNFNRFSSSIFYRINIE